MFCFSLQNTEGTRCCKNPLQKKKRVRVFLIIDYGHWQFCGAVREQQQQRHAARTTAAVTLLPPLPRRHLLWAFCLPRWAGSPTARERAGFDDQHNMFGGAHRVGLEECR